MFKGKFVCEQLLDPEPKHKPLSEMFMAFGINFFFRRRFVIFFLVLHFAYYHDSHSREIYNDFDLLIFLRFRQTIRIECMFFFLFYQENWVNFVRAMMRGFVRRYDDGISWQAI